MGCIPLSLVPKSTLGIEAHCAWAPEPVFTLGESARILGVKRRAIDQVRVRFLEVKLPPKVCDGLSHTFGPSFTQFGEVTITLETPGGPQDHVCLTHYGLFRHAVYIRTPQARRFVLRYPEFVLALTTGQFRAPAKIAARYKFILSASTRVYRLQNMWYVEAEFGILDRTMRRHLSKIQQGKVDSSGLPIRRKPGPVPKGKPL